MPLQGSTVLIIDDEAVNVRLLERILEQQDCRNIVTTTDSREAAVLYDRHQPDIVLLDLMMPHLNGFELMEQFQSLTPSGSYCPILVLTADVNLETKHKALASGAKDFLTKPFDQSEVVLRVRNLVEVHTLHKQLQNHNQLLEDKVRERTHELEESQTEILERLTQAAEYRDDDTGQHTFRVGEFCYLIARELQLPPAQLSLLRRAAPLHDVGKIGISDLILLKPGKLTPEEFEVMKTHTSIGARILAEGRSDLMRMAERIALTHHERWDGNGYPYGFQADEISLEGRIVAVADVFDALTHDRPYKKAWPQEDAIEEIKSQSGRQFDPTIVEAFLRLHQQSVL
jgi:putative two-component system response regulator